jgi:hypothetical protein
VTFLVIVGVWVVAAGGQIVQQVLFPAVIPSPYPTCEAGLKKLDEGLASARKAAAEGDDDPDEALRRFRASLEPEWRYLEGIRATCTGSEDLRGLDALERLRYAEEHAVRREAASLAALRRRVDHGKAGSAPPEASPSDAPKDHQ